MNQKAPAFSRTSLLHIAVAISAVMLTSGLGQIGTARSLADWYPALIKPGFTPPNLVFPIAWTALFALMAYAFWRILESRPESPGRTHAIRLFLAQLVLNATWSWAFFGYQNPKAGLAVILILEVVILLTLRSFWRIDRLSGWCLVPYAAWVAFATLLNASIVWLNP